MFFKFSRQKSEMNLKAIWSKFEIWKSNLKSGGSIWTNLNQLKSEVLKFYLLPVWNKYERNLKPTWNLKSQSETELDGKANLTQSETEIKGKVNWT